MSVIDDELIPAIRREPAILAMLQAAMANTRAALELATEKAICHRADPGRYPLPAGPALEHAVLAAITGMPEAPLRRLAERFGATGEDAAARRARLGPLPALDLTSPAAIVDALHGRALAAMPAEARTGLASALARVGGAVSRLAGGPPRPLVPSLRLTRAECVEKTRELFEGKDEISLAISALGSPQAASSITVDLGSFKQGQAHDVNAMLTFPAGAAARPVLASFLVTEVDRGPHAAEGDDLRKLVQGSAVLAFLELANLGADAVPAVIASLPTAVVDIVAVITVVGAIVLGVELGTLILDALRAWASDDPFVPVIDGFDGSVAQTRTVTARRPHGRGIYRLTYQVLLAPA